MWVGLNIFSFADLSIEDIIATKDVPSSLRGIITFNHCRMKYNVAQADSLTATQLNIISLYHPQENLPCTDSGAPA